MTGAGGEVTPTTWSCPGCALTLEATAVAVGHACPSRGDQLTDLTPTDVTATPNRNNKGAS